MKDGLIDRKEILKELTMLAVGAPRTHVRAYARCVSKIETAPAVDAVPVVHGRWIHLGGDEWCCSACGDVIHTEGSWERPSKKYCSECGAKMDKEACDA